MWFFSLSFLSVLMDQFAFLDLCFVSSNLVPHLGSHLLHHSTPHRQTLSCISSFKKAIKVLSTVLSWWLSAIDFAEIWGNYCFCKIPHSRHHHQSLHHHDLRSGLHHNLILSPNHPHHITFSYCHLHHFANSHHALSTLASLCLGLHLRKNHHFSSVDSWFTDYPHMYYRIRLHSRSLCQHFDH